MHYVWDFAILGKYSHLFWLGLGWTLLYTVGSIVLGSLIGLLVGILRLRRLRVIDWLLVAYIELFRCTPLLVQIIWFYYAFPVVVGVNIPAHVAAMSVLSLYGGAFYAEIVRGSIESVPRGQWDAARALGLRPWRVLRLVILPQALKPMLAPYVNQSVTQLKNTSLVSVIAVPDLFRHPVPGHLHRPPAGKRNDLRQGLNPSAASRFPAAGRSPRLPLWRAASASRCPSRLPAASG